MNPDTYKNENLKVHKNLSVYKLLNLFSLKRNVLPTEEVDSSEIRYLLECLRQSREEWIDASRSFDYAGSVEITDYCTYRLKACEIRYGYFLKKVKEAGINPGEYEAVPF